MAKDPSGVAKLVVVVRYHGTTLVVLSKKRSKGKSKHRQLELLGGGLDDEPDPLEGLLRELEEEEKSGLLAAKIRETRPTGTMMIIDGMPHHVFETEISIFDYVDLQHARKESFGFKLLPLHVLSEGELQWRLTPKSRVLLARWLQLKKDQAAPNAQ